MIGLAAAALAIWLYLIAFHGRFWQAGPVLKPDMPATPCAIDVIVPARDEAESIEASLRSLLAQTSVAGLRVILVDDGSTDGTGAIARAIGDERLTVIEGAARPAGWSGKLWAVNQGVAASRAEFLLLTDADIVHAPGHAATLAAKALRDDLDMVSEMVALSCESLAEKILVPAFVFFFQLLYPFARVNNLGSRTAAAAGGTVLIRRRALDRIGGIETIRGALIDDVALAVAVKRGGRIWLGHSMLARSIRPYPDAADIWRMIARTAFVQLRFSLPLLALCIIGMVMTWLVGPAAALFGHHGARWIGLAATGLSMASYLPTLRRFGLSAAWALFLPAIAVFYLAATIGSAVNHWRGRGVVWKSRAYQGAGA